MIGIFNGGIAVTHFDQKYVWVKEEARHGTRRIRLIALKGGGFWPCITFFCHVTLVLISPINDIKARLVHE